jgi:hypothetical protein
MSILAIKTAGGILSGGNPLGINFFFFGAFEARRCNYKGFTEVPVSQLGGTCLPFISRGLTVESTDTATVGHFCYIIFVRMLDVQIPIQKAVWFLFVSTRSGGCLLLMKKEQQSAAVGTRICVRKTHGIMAPRA